jgi:cell wall-associated NlpC family hydrolase
MSRIRQTLTAAAATGLIAATGLSLAPSAHAATDSRRWRAYEHAVAQRGCWYVFGAEGPCSNGFDCSGLVMSSYASVGIYTPRTTYGMLGWWRLRRVTHAQSRMGDLAFYGSGHVELVAGRHYTFGAAHSGTRVGWHRWSSYYHPTAYYHVRYSG